MVQQDYGGGQMRGIFDGGYGGNVPQDRSAAAMAMISEVSFFLLEEGAMDSRAVGGLISGLFFRRGEVIKRKPGMFPLSSQHYTLSSRHIVICTSSGARMCRMSHVVSRASSP